MASQKLTNCGAITEPGVIFSLLRRTYETLHATSLQRQLRALHLALFASPSDFLLSAKASTFTG
jgi:hypothetical protein